MHQSHWGAQFSRGAGIVDLMEDLGEALHQNPQAVFLGGGNPAGVPVFEQHIGRVLRELSEDRQALRRLVGVYQSPRGDDALLDVLVAYLNARLGWAITRDHLVVCNGSQSAFFMLMNLLAGSGCDGRRHWVLPMLPEYLGYAAQMAEPDCLRAYLPRIENLDAHRFRYRIDFDALKLRDDDAAVCVSRPGNPTGNILSEKDLLQLHECTTHAGIPLVIDTAYGDPFPGLVHDSTRKGLPFLANTIYVMSLSKLGLPGARTGIVIAPPEIAQALVNMNTVMSLASGNLGPAILTKLIESNQLDFLCQTVIQPFYKNKRTFALDYVASAMSDLDYCVHAPDGGFFLWIAFPSLPMDSEKLYQALKARGVIVMSGHHFFYGNDEVHQHPHVRCCLRLTYCTDEAKFSRGIDTLSELVRNA